MPPQARGWTRLCAEPAARKARAGGGREPRGPLGQGAGQGRADRRGVRGSCCGGSPGGALACPAPANNRAGESARCPAPRARGRARTGRVPRGLPRNRHRQALGPPLCSGDSPSAQPTRSVSPSAPAKRQGRRHRGAGPFSLPPAARKQPGQPAGHSRGGEGRR